MPRLSKIDIATRDALNVLKSVSKKLDPRTVAKYERQIIKSNRIDTINKVIVELNLINDSNRNNLTTPQIKSIVKQGQQLNNNLSKHTLKFTYENVSNNIYLHSKEVKDMFRSHPNSIVDNGIVYIDTNNKPIEGTVSIRVDGEDIQFDNDHVLITKEETRRDKKFFDKLFQRFSITGSQGEYWYVYVWCRSNPKRKAIMTTTAFDPISITRQQIKDALDNQVYRDNNNGTCVYDGFVNFFQSKLNENNKDRKAKQFLNRLINQSIEYKKEYNNDNLHTIGELCNTTIYIKNLIDGSTRKFNENNQNRYMITFFQSTINHVDLLFTHKEPENVSVEQYEKIKEDAIWYIEDCGLLTTLDKKNKSYTYKVIKTPFQIAAKEWKQQVKYDMMSMNCDDDAMKLLQQVDINQHRFFNKSMPINNELYEEIDQTKAYANVL
jgi:hypothetical protein